MSSIPQENEKKNNSSVELNNQPNNQPNNQSNWFNFSWISSMDNTTMYVVIIIIILLAVMFTPISDYLPNYTRPSNDGVLDDYLISDDTIDPNINDFAIEKFIHNN